MGFNLNGTTLTSSSGLVATYGGNQILKHGTTGILERYNAGQVLFQAGGSGTAAQVSIGTAATWNPIVLNATAVNVGSCYNTSNGRFTAPVTAIYIVAASTYVTGQAAGWFVHSMFWVNGSSTLRRPGGPAHRIVAHGNTNGYSASTDSFEIMTLTAGDYVQFYNYPGAAANLYVPQYSRFEGYLLG